MPRRALRLAGTGVTESAGVTRAWNMVVIVAAIAVLAVPAAFAARSPSLRERTAIINAVKASRLTSAVRDNEYSVRRIRVSTVGPYARGEVFGVGRYRNTVQPASVLLHKRQRRWHLVDIGGVLSCRDASSSVLRDLQISCVP